MQRSHLRVLATNLFP